MRLKTQKRFRLEHIYKKTYKCNPFKYSKILKDKIIDNYKKNRFNNRIF